MSFAYFVTEPATHAILFLLIRKTPLLTSTKMLSLHRLGQHLTGFDNKPWMMNISEYNLQKIELIIDLWRNGCHILPTQRESSLCYEGT